MSQKINTQSILFDIIEEEWAWRFHELTHFKKTIPDKENDKQTVLIRAGIALLYAHWEGFIKAITEYYYEFVKNQNLNINELNLSFKGILFRKEINEFVDTKRVSSHNKILNSIFSQVNEKANFPSNPPIQTSNLNFNVLEDVCAVIGINISNFELKKNFINKILIERRNIIAHGKKLPYDMKLSDYNEMFENVITMLEQIKTEIQNSAVQKKYKINEGIKRND